MTDPNEAINGVRLLLRGLALLCFVEGSEDDWEVLQVCSSATLRNHSPSYMVQECNATAKSFISSTGDSKKNSKKRQAEDTSEEDRPPIDFIVDIIIGLLERSTAFPKSLANLCFAMISSLLTKSSVDLILAVSV